MPGAPLGQIFEVKVLESSDLSASDDVPKEIEVSVCRLLARPLLFVQRFRNDFSDNPWSLTSAGLRTTVPRLSALMAPSAANAPTKRRRRGGRHRRKTWTSRCTLFRHQTFRCQQLRH